MAKRLIDRAQIVCGISRDPREGLWIIKLLKVCLQQDLIFENFGNPLIFFKSAKFVFFSFYNVYKEKMFTIEVEEIIVFNIFLNIKLIYTVSPKKN